jgi:hypothetical protein
MTEKEFWDKFNEKHNSKYYYETKKNKKVQKSKYIYKTKNDKTRS